MSKTKKFLLAILIIAVTSVILSISAFAETTGTFYQGVTYSLSDDGKTITISCADGVSSFDGYTNTKSHIFLLSEFANINTAILEGDDLITLGSGSFALATGIQKIVIPDTVTSIGEYAFANCFSLTTIYTYTDSPSEAEVAEVGTIDIRGVGSVGRLLFQNAFAWGWGDSDFVLPAGLTIKFGNTQQTVENIFYYFGNTSYNFNGKTITLEAYEGSTLAEDIETTFADTTITTLGNVPKSVFLFTEVEAPLEIITGNLATGVTYELEGDKLTIICDETITMFAPGTSNGVGIGNKYFNNTVNGRFYIKEIVLVGANLTAIGPNGLSHMAAAETIVIPDTITTLGNQAFAYSMHLKALATYDASAADLRAAAETALVNAKKGEIDLSNISSFSTQTFIGAFNYGYAYSAGALRAVDYVLLTIKLNANATNILNNFGPLGYEQNADAKIINFEVPKGSIAENYLNSHLDGTATVDSCNIPTSYILVNHFVGLFNEGVEYIVSSDLKTVTVICDDDISTFGSSATWGSSFFKDVWGADSTTAPSRWRIKTAILKGKGLTALGAYSFGGFLGVEKIVLPNTITHIDQCAFDACWRLATIATYENDPSEAENAPIGTIDLSAVKTFGRRIFNGAFFYSWDGGNADGFTVPEELTLVFGDTKSAADSLLDGFGITAYDFDGKNIIFEVYENSNIATGIEVMLADSSTTNLGNIPKSVFELEEIEFPFVTGLEADNVGVLFRGGHNGIRYDFTFDKTVKSTQEAKGYTFVEYGIIYSSAADIANATISLVGDEYVTPSANIVKQAVLVGDEWAEGAKILEDTVTSTRFAGTLINCTAENYTEEFYICAYSVYRNRYGVDIINYVSYGNAEGHNSAFETSSLSELINYNLANGGFDGLEVSELAVWNTLLLGATDLDAETDGEQYELVVDSNTKAILIQNGATNIMVVRTLDGTAVPEASVLAAETAVGERGYAVSLSVPLTVSINKFNSIKINGISISDYNIYSANVACSERLASNIWENLSGETVGIMTEMAESGGPYIVLEPTSMDYTHYDVELDGNDLIVSGSYKSCYEFFDYFVKLNESDVNITTSFEGDIDDPELYTKQELMYVLNMVYNEDRLIIGQESFGGTKVPYAGAVDPFNKATGEDPGIVGVDLSWAGLRLYEDAGGSEKATDELKSQAFCEMVEYAEKGGIFTVGSHFLNPNTSGYSHLGEGHECHGFLGNDSAFADLITPGTALNTNFKAEIDADIAFLSACKEIGLAVIWRPFHEMNMSSFWWCTRQRLADDSLQAIQTQSFINLWEYVYNQFSVAGIDNLIWHYCPDTSGLDVMQTYPGDSYCDIVGVDWYTGGNLEILSNNGRQPLAALMNTGKIVSIGEMGHWDAHEDGMDYVEDLRTIFDQGGKLAYAMTWTASHSFEYLGRGEEAMATGLFICRDELVDYFAMAREDLGSNNGN